VVDGAALRHHVQPALPLLFGELTPGGAVLHHQVPASGDQEAQRQREPAAQNAHPHPDPAAALGLQTAHGGSRASNYSAGGKGCPEATRSSSSTSGSWPAGKIRSALGSLMPSIVRATISTRSGVLWLLSSSSRTRLTSRRRATRAWARPSS